MALLLRVVLVYTVESFYNKSLCDFSLTSTCTVGIFETGHNGDCFWEITEKIRSEILSLLNLKVFGTGVVHSPGRYLLHLKTTPT